MHMCSSIHSPYSSVVCVYWFSNDGCDRVDGDGTVQILGVYRGATWGNFTPQKLLSMRS